jgi:hypothetical protein
MGLEKLQESIATPSEAHSVLTNHSQTPRLSLIRPYHPIRRRNFDSLVLAKDISRISNSIPNLEVHRFHRG